MKKKLLYIFLFFLFSFVVKAQDEDINRSEGPFNEPRFNYFLKTILLYNEYLDTKNGSFNTTNLRVLHPIGNKSWNLRFDLPLISTNSNSTNQTGLGDVGAGISYIPYFKKNEGFAVRTRVTANSAVDPSFGSGKWVVIPAVFYARYFKQKKFLWISDMEHSQSFAGSSNRSDVSVTILENNFLWFFGKNWIATDVAFRYNYVLDGFQNNAFVEFGRKITPTNLAYVHPSVAFGGEKSYNFGVEMGLLILF
ncbi:lipid A phosphoethanolamine transferase [Flavobacterium sp. KACC 22761]|uniref:lipid A phosphoethanolamine transferase n=1 Tax=Flavobacterium sp. KACC 22761 TaxID=3092665 RepID=UPI002A74CB05|nr:lipid A phosphoethanolamine transferase [Flavobacterium sp. KACC 22761]WPO77510.1 lipid A phosphoethanolamine transferase [Flavobacterium sp. KACC 22761]